MLIRNIIRAIIDELKTITIEPVIFFFCLAWSVIYGAEITTNLMMWKFCHLELNYTEEICSNLTLAENKEVQKEVQVFVNNFQMYSNWIPAAPLILFSIIAGALSDVFGRKPLLLYPLCGYLIGSIMNIINYAFIEVLPVEFFYMNRINALFGGYAVMWLGIYGYVTTVTKPGERAYRLTRLDGVMTLSSVTGTFLSPYIFENMGYYGNYCLSSLLFCFAIIYLHFFVPEPIDTQKQKDNLPENLTFSIDKNLGFLPKILHGFKQILKISILVPIEGMKSVIVKDRKTIIKVMIGLQFMCYLIYMTAGQVYRLFYLYMMLVFENFSPKDYAHLNVTTSLIRSFFLIVLMPILSGKLKIHDAMLTTIFVTCEVVSSILKPLTSSLWQYYFAHLLGVFGYCKFGIVRSLLSKSVDANEVGKFFSLLALVSAVAPMFGNPAFRQLYNYTLDYCPGMFFYVSAGITTIAAAANIFIFIKRDHLRQIEQEQMSQEKNEI